MCFVYWISYIQLYIYFQINSSSNDARLANVGLDDGLSPSWYQVIVETDAA